MRSITSATVLLFTTLVLPACGDSATGISGTAPTGDGAWQGSRISFVRHDDTLTDFVLIGIMCEADDCSKGRERVASDVEIELDGQSFQGMVGDIDVSGRFISETEVEGTWTLLPGSCCNATGLWSAEYVPPEAPGGTGDTTGTGTGTSGEGTTMGGGGDPGSDVIGTDGIVEQPAPGDYVVAEGASADQMAAMSRTNWYRANVGVSLVDNHIALNRSAQSHADYFALHSAAYQSGAVPGGAHSESPDIEAGFTGKDFAARMSAAGYPGQPGFEVMAFQHQPAAAVDGWMATVYHRIPFMSPDMVHVGYGGASGVDVMNFGREGSSDMELVVLYPWPGQTDVPKSWNGAESPQPPIPETGYPSGPVITATTADGAPLEIVVHRLLDSDGNEIAHVWHPKGSNGFMAATWALYAHDPLAGGREFTVELEGTLGDSDWSRSWSFRTLD